MRSSSNHRRPAARRHHRLRRAWASPLMVLDSSAIVAIFLNEPDAALFERRIADDPIRLISAGTLVETGMLIESKMGAIGGRELDLWLQRAKVEIVSVDEEQVEFARR